MGAYFQWGLIITSTHVLSAVKEALPLTLVLSPPEHTGTAPNVWLE